MPNTREKLIELIQSAVGGCAEYWAMVIADHLIDSGVTVLPLNVGHTVYFPVEDYHDSAIIEKINITEQGISFAWVQYEVGVDITECWDDGEFDIDEIGKTVFLFREEAEKALAERSAANG